VKRPTEDTVCTLIMLTLGGVAAAGSFSHIRETAAAHGQDGWIAYAIAGTVDLLALGSGLEIRRRRRVAAGVVWPWVTLLLGVAMTLGSNLATAEATGWGAVMAVWPAVAFLAAVLLIETRGPARHRADVAAVVATTEGVVANPAAAAPVAVPNTSTVPNVAAPAEPVATAVATPRPRRVATPPKGDHPTVADRAARIAAARVADPNRSPNAVAAATGIPYTTVRRYWDQTTPAPHLAAVREDTSP
jgi:hypothetical protein